MGSIKDFLVRTPVLGRCLLLWHRYRVARSYLMPSWRRLRPWLFASRETTNFTYDLQPSNAASLASFVADIAERPVEEVEGYMGELEADVSLREHVARLTSEDPVRRRTADPVPRYGRRAGWYALVRCLRPKVVVETGVDKGLGSVVLTAALLRNARDGHPGRYYGTDINPRAGFLLKEPYSAVGSLLIGDSIESLGRFREAIDLFINDSDHSAGYEGREYRTIEGALGPASIVLGDNAHVTDELRQFARRTGRTFLYFQERPLDHWYPGGGIGVAFRRRPRAGAP